MSAFILPRRPEASSFVAMGGSRCVDRTHRPVRALNNRKSRNMTALNGAVVLVTGANGGIGTHFVHDALARGASKVYATARNPRTWDDKRIVPLALDVTDPASIQAAVEAAGDITVLINNAGTSVSSAGILSHTDEEIRTNVETNFLGPLFLARAFAPVLATRAEPAIIDVHSALSWYAVGGVYSATKAALWSATNSLRLELDPQGVHVVGVHVGYVDTPMAAHVTDPKTDPADLVRIVFDAVEAGEYEVLADEVSVQAKAGLSAPLEAVYPELKTANA
jgi:NAD(P)-dependent dehydrogenase (short-subunit alcohol dehydrogenase family)